ncbi:polysaccharide pyruvyl transferase family protein [Patescibacteria group bacterium]|nr:polysaccharide pyruvyl transferase family protein [Patescibacteria group bacterium]
MKIAIIGNYGAGNIGDEMILAGLLEILKNQHEAIVLSANPAETQKQHQVKAISQYPGGIRSLIKNLFKKSDKKAFKDSKAVIIGGGGLFAGPERRANIIWGIHALMALIYTKPLFMLGQSIGSPKSFLEKKLIQYLFKKAKYISVRDSDSKKELEKLGVKAVNLHPDFAFFQNPMLKATKKTKQTIVALRQKPLSKKEKQEIAKKLDKIAKTSPLNFLLFQPNTDKEITAQITSLMQNKNYKISPSLSIKQTLEEINKSKYLVGMRLHSLISALICHTPFTAIPYAKKVESLLKDIAKNTRPTNTEQAKKEILKALDRIH